MALANNLNDIYKQEVKLLRESPAGGTITNAENKLLDAIQVKFNKGQKLSESEIKFIDTEAHEYMEKASSKDPKKERTMINVKLTLTSLELSELHHQSIDAILNLGLTTFHKATRPEQIQTPIHQQTEFHTKLLEKDLARNFSRNSAA